MSRNRASRLTCRARLRQRQRRPWLSRTLARTCRLGHSPCRGIGLIACGTITTCYPFTVVLACLLLPILRRLPFLLLNRFGNRYRLGRREVLPAHVLVALACDDERLLRPYFKAKSETTYSKLRRNRNAIHAIDRQRHLPKDSDEALLYLPNTIYVGQIPYGAPGILGAGAWFGFRRVYGTNDAAPLLRHGVALAMTV